MTAAALLPPAGLPGLDPAWSRLVEVPRVDGRGGSDTWHVLDNAVDLAAGDETAGTLLCVHGNPTWSYLWRDVARAASKPADGGRPWRVIAVDQLGMGFSERTGRTHRLRDRVVELGALTDALGLTGPVVTVGHDWGGAVSLGWAVEHRAQLAGVVLTNTAVHQDLGVAAPAPLRLALTGGVLRTSTVTTTAFLETALALAHPPLSAAVRDAYRAPYRTRARRVAIGDFVADIPLAADHPSRPALDDLAAAVRTLDVPAFVAWGPRDPVFVGRFLDDVLDRLPQADVHRFEGAGHLVAEDVDFAGALLTWLTDQEVDTPDLDTPDLDAPELEDGVTRTPFRPLGAAVDERADDDGPALVELAPIGGGGPRSISWALLARRVDEIARGMGLAGVGRGDRVCLLVPPGADLTAALYACLRIGAVVVVADAGLGIRGLSRAVRGASPDVVIGVERALLAARALGWPARRFGAGPMSRASRRLLGVETTLVELAASGRTPLGGVPAALPSGGVPAAMPLGGVPAALPPAPGPHDPAAVLFTSGSTGPAKGVAYTHGQLAAMRDVVGTTYGIGPGTAFVAGFAPFALLGPALGATCACPDMDVTAPRTLTAAALAAAVAAIDAAVVFASPAALTAVVASADGLDEEGRRALAGVGVFLSAGAPVPPELLAAAGALMPAAAPHTPYGMTEALLVTDISLDEIRAAAGGEPAVRGVCVGRPVEGVRIAISPLDDRGAATGALTGAPGVTGEILIRGAHVMDHYDRLWLTQRASARDVGWHRTGDVGQFDDADRLWVEGRLRHVITTAEGVLTPVRFERLAEGVAGVGRAAAVGVGPAGVQQVVLVVETVPATRRPGLATTELTARVRASIDRPVAAVFAVPRLPTDVRHNSKVQRTRIGIWAGRALAGGRLGAP
ncbi:alpha/beta fold hydrolase [Pengzhenrongella frigida]|uniref:alpha/beta fold hydrolase n=1 Tax=Pengzhenrongella frigida TaxID=1259133 RepID=UPI001F5C35E2|nr:alpha/beta fold hydrolase [Cellulomonas sp. HLT2-17]